MGFGRKKDFRSSFKEERKSNEAPKKRRKQGEASHDRAPGCTAAHPTVRPGTTMPCPSPARGRVFRSFYFVSASFFPGDFFQTSFRARLGRKIRG